MSDPTTSRKVGLICSGLQRTGDRELLANALTEVAALPCSSEGLELRASVAVAGGLESITTTLLTAHGDVRLQCKAINALASLLMSEEVARGFSATSNSSAVVDRLGDMLRSRSQWAQADAAACLGWLVGHIQGTVLHELLPLMTQLMVKHTTTDDEVFLREERQREDRKSWGRNRSGKAGVGGDGVGGGRRGRGGDISGGRGESSKDLDQDGQAQERMDNIRVYTLIFLLKASHADPSTMPAMVEAGAIPGLLRHLASSTEKPLLADIEQQSPSLLLAARLLYAFSLDPGVRASLLEAKALPPLIRLRRKLEAATAAYADSIPAAAAGKGRTGVEDGAGLRDRASRQQRERDELERVREDTVQPPLETMVGLIVDQMVGKTSSSSAASKAPVDRSVCCS